VANVAATANLQSCIPDLPVTGKASVDAVGLERQLVKNIPVGNGDGTASIGGEALAVVNVKAGASSLELSGNAIGIDHSTLYGAPTLNTSVSGSGLALFNLEGNGSAAVDPVDASFGALTGIGIRCSSIFTGSGNDNVTGVGGVVSSGANFNGDESAYDTAGIHGSSIYTAIGNDRIFGKVLNEIEADFDANGDGVLSAGIYLDKSATDPSQPAGFDGIRKSLVDGGIGNDSIAGSAHSSQLSGSIGNDNISLDKAWDANLWGGLDEDRLSVNGEVKGDVVLWGGLGNDSLQGGNGADGNANNQYLDGGFGQDVTTGGDGIDRFLFGNAAAALDASSGARVNGDLTSTGYWSSLSDAQKGSLWDTGSVKTSTGTVLGSIDTIRNFKAGDGGDVLEISSSLAGLTEQLWQNNGELFGVNNKGQLTEDGGELCNCSKIGVVVGALADIQKLGICSPHIAYATDTHQLMYDADGDWSAESVSLGTVNISGDLTKSNFSFGSTSGAGLGSNTAAGVC